MKLSEFEYHLPSELIAAKPPEPRDHARLMVVNRADDSITHARFDELGKWIHQDDLLILNNSRVLPARLSAEGGKVEILLLEETSPRHWLAIGKPGRKLKPQHQLQIEPRKEGLPPQRVEVLKTLSDGSRVVRFFEEFNLEDYGVPPLPHYIQDARREAGMEELLGEDDEWYQTVYAAEAGSVAAPTAGLHFTPELLGKFHHRFLTLHVGLGTFRPVKVAEIEDHEMHSERYNIPEGLCEAANHARKIVAVGTTAARVIESVPSLEPGSGSTRIFIRPPYKPRRVDALITNFHLPGSTLLMLVAGFMGIGLQRKAYEEAIREKYRFYSYGDAMLIL